MKILMVSIVSMVISFNSFAQTEKIAHRSHSGNNNNFRITGKDNWGIPTIDKAKTTKADSLKNKSDSLLRKTSSKSPKKRSRQGKVKAVPVK